MLAYSAKAMLYLRAGTLFHFTTVFDVRSIKRHGTFVSRVVLHVRNTTR